MEIFELSDLNNEIPAPRLQRTANEAAKTPMDLIKANQAKVQKDEHDDLASMTEEEIRAELARLEGV